MMEKSILRSLILEFLSRTPAVQIVEAIREVERITAERDLFPKREDCKRLGIDYRDYERKQLNNIDKFLIREIIWDLIIERIITPGLDESNPNMPFFRLTEFGKEYTTQSPPHYYDPQGYMQSLKSIVPTLDLVIEQYIFEGVRCYRQQLIFASAVMLGAAAEKAILLLLEAIANSITNQAVKNKVNKLIDRPNLPDIFDIIEKTLNPIIRVNTIPYTIHRGCLEHLLSLQEMIRVQRNDAIHPVSGQIDKTKILLSLQTIPVALESVYNLINWLENNTIP